MDKKEILYYGQVYDGIVFARPELLEDLLNKRKSMATAKTWQDYIDATSIEEFHSLMMEILEILGHEKLFQNYLNGEDLSVYEEGLYLPQASDPFSEEIIPGDYLPMASQEMLTFIPEDLQEAMGEMSRDAHREFYFKINPEHESLAVKTFETLGFKCEKKEELLKKAEGEIPIQKL